MHLNQMCHFLWNNRRAAQNMRLFNQSENTKPEIEWTNHRRWTERTKSFISARCNFISFEFLYSEICFTLIKYDFAFALNNFSCRHKNHQRKRWSTTRETEENHFWNFTLQFSYFFPSFRLSSFSVAFARSFILTNGLAVLPQRCVERET